MPTRFFARSKVALPQNAASPSQASASSQHPLLGLRGVTGRSCDSDGLIGVSPYHGTVGIKFVSEPVSPARSPLEGQDHIFDGFGVANSGAQRSALPAAGEKQAWKRKTAKVQNNVSKRAESQPSGARCVGPNTGLRRTIILNQIQWRSSEGVSPLIRTI